MNIPRHYPTPAPLLFGSRYKSKKEVLDDIDLNQKIGNASFILGSIGSTAIPAGPAAILPIFTGSGFASSAFEELEVLNAELKEFQANEPLPETPEQSIKKALETLDTDRKKQREMKDQILKACEAEEAKLATLRQEAALTPPPATDEPLTLAQELELHKKGLEIQNQEKTVTQMKIHAEAATALDNQFETQMLEVKKRYLGMIDQLQQVEQNKKMLEMQKNLEQLKGSTLQSPELQSIQEKLDEELNKSNGLVENFLVEASTLSQLQAQEHRDLIESLKKSQ